MSTFIFIWSFLQSVCSLKNLCTTQGCGWKAILLLQHMHVISIKNAEQGFILGFTR